MSPGPFVGIDLGTTYSEIAVLDESGLPRVLRIDGSPMVPSVVSVAADGGLLVGRAALNNAAAAPEQTVRWVKRWMGKDKRFRLGERDYTPPEISGLILRYLKDAAEQQLGCAIDSAVVSVPAYFDEPARQATRQAAELAGLRVPRLMSEPTAAAVAYARDNRRDETWLIYDFGGGTFDASLVRCSDGVMEVLASHGDVDLGGHDIDRLLADEVLREEQLPDEAGLRHRCLEAVEAAKIALSDSAETRIRYEYLTRAADGSARHLDRALTRTSLEERIQGMLERSLSCVAATLQQADLRPGDLDRVLLVGGSARIPLAAQLLEQRLGRWPQAWIDPDLVVAQGACLEAALDAGQTIGTVVADITPHSYGLGAMDDDFTMSVAPLIRRNTPLPASVLQVFYRGHEHQRKVIFPIFQGESRVPHECLQIGEFDLVDLGHSAHREIACRFTLDRSGILTVAVEDRATGRSAELVIDRQQVQRADPCSLADLPMHAASETAWEDGDDAYAAERPPEFLEPAAPPPPQETEQPELAGPQIIARAEALLAGDSLSEDDRQDLQEALAAAGSGDAEELQALNDLLYFLG